MLIGLMSLLLVAPAEDFKQENTPENLKATMLRLRSLIHDKKNVEAAEQLFVGLLPDQARLKKAVNDKVDDSTFDKLWQMHQQMRAAKPDLSKLCKPEQTDVQVHGATTEEIAEYKDGGVPFKEFPGGAKRVAEKLLKPGMTFYEVEFLEPGKDAGMKFHLFYWDGEKWTMAGPLWRAVREQ